MKKSYSSEGAGILSFLREISSLFQLHSGDISTRVRTSIAEARYVEARVKEYAGKELRDLDMLEIGPGQFLSQLTYFAVQNRAVAIDRDVIVRGLDPLSYLTMLRHNGVGRTIKTIGRKFMGVDRRYALELTRQLGLRHHRQLTVYAMDVCKMSFPSDSFDFVYSRSVLHSLRDPVAAIDEIVRVLRAGGIAYVSIHPYTSATGCLDSRIYTARKHEVEGWPHLRPHLQGTLCSPNLYLSKLRIEDWCYLFGSKMAGAKYIVIPSGDCAVLEAAKTLQSKGELLNFSLEELTAGEFVAVWKKPGHRVPGKHTLVTSLDNTGNMVSSR